MLSMFTELRNVLNINGNVLYRDLHLYVTFTWSGDVGSYCTNTYLIS